MRPTTTPPVATRSRVAAAILAGGRGARLGGACKPLLSIGGRTILDRQLDVLVGLFDEILLITNDPALFSGWPIATRPDRVPGAGPLAGIDAALDATSAEYVFVVAGDLPAIDAAVISLICAAPPCDAAAIYSARGPEPLCARYSRSAAPEVRRALDEERLAVRDLYRRLAVHRIDEAAGRALDPALRCLENVNTPDDLTRMEAWFAGGAR